MNEGNRNKKRIKIVGITFLILLLVLVITYAGYRYYKNNVVGQMLKEELLTAMKNHDLAFFLEEACYENIANRVEKNDFVLTSQMAVSTTMENNMFSNLDLSKFEFLYQLNTHKSENKKAHKLQAKYAGNDLLTFDFLTTQNQVAVKSDEIVNRYVGIDRENLPNIINRFYNTQVDLSDFRKLKNMTIDRERLDFSKLQNNTWMTESISSIQKEILPNRITKKENVVVTMNSDQLATTEYTVEFDQEQVGHFLDNLLEIIASDTEVIPELVVSHVQNTEIESNGILEYTDNENTVEIPGQENNFHTSLEIWGQNTTNETQILNTLPANTTLEQDNTTNTVANQIANETTSENTVTNTVTEENPPQPEETSENPTEQPVENQPESDQSENLPSEIQEEDNFRTQGFIEINENSEGNEEDTNFIIGQNQEETLKNISNWISQINWSTYLLTGAKANCTQEDLKEEFQRMIVKRKEQKNSLQAKIYIKEGKTVKVHLEFPENSESLDVEILSKSDNEKYLNITVLRGEEKEASGSVLSIYHKKSDAVRNSKFTLSHIRKNEIKQKTNLNVQTKGTLNAKKYTTDMDMTYSDSEGEFKVECKNTLDFDRNSEIENLNEQNCLFLDTLPNEEFLLNTKAIEQKTIEVLREKNRNLNIIDLNNSNLIVKQTDQNTNEEENNAKEQAKQALIETIRGKMTDYLQQGQNLRIEDLEGLEIPGYEVNLSISSNLAIITVNGFHFKLDSEFNLSD